MHKQVLLSVATVWAICAILTVTDVLSADDAARTDSKLKIMTGSSWFRFPYPCKISGLLKNSCD